MVAEETSHITWSISGCHYNDSIIPFFSEETLINLPLTRHSLPIDRLLGKNSYLYVSPKVFTSGSNSNYNLDQCKYL